MSNNESSLSDSNAQQTQFETLKDFLVIWLRRVERIAAYHQTAYKRLEKLHVWIGCTILVITNILLAMTFIPYSITTPAQFKTIVAVTSIAASILVAIQTFLDWRMRAEQHRSAAIKYNNLKTHIEMILAEKNITKGSVDGVKQELEKLRMTSPSIPESAV